MWYCDVENSDIWRSSLLLSTLHLCRRHGEHSTGFQRLPRHNSAHAPAPVRASMIRRLSLAQHLLILTQTSPLCCRRARPGPARCDGHVYSMTTRDKCTPPPMYTHWRLCLCCPRVPALLAGLFFCCCFGLFVCRQVLASCSSAIHPTDGILFLLFMITSTMFVCG